MTDFFKGIPAITYQGPESESDFAFRHYDPNALIAGKPMKDHLRFAAAYCNSPLCAPSRFAFMSGQLISRIAAYDNASEFKASIPTFAHYLQALGYRTCLSGKMHFVGPAQMHGFQDRVTTDIYPSDFAWTPDG